MLRGPTRHGRVEAHVEVGALDSRVGERPPVAPQVAATIEGGKHPLHALEHRCVVGDGPQEAEHLVESSDLRSVRESPLRESVEQAPLRQGCLLPERPGDGLELAKKRSR